jgi:hypothetical protein
VISKTILDFTMRAGSLMPVLSSVRRPGLAKGVNVLTVRVATVTASTVSSAFLTTAGSKSKEKHTRNQEKRNYPCLHNKDLQKKYY